MNIRSLIAIVFGAALLLASCQCVARADQRHIGSSAFESTGGKYELPV